MRGEVERQSLSLAPLIAHSTQVLCPRGVIQMQANRMTPVTPITKRDEIKRPKRGSFINIVLPSAKYCPSRRMMGAAGFEPEQDLAPLGLAGFESFADTSGSSRPLVAQKWALQAFTHRANGPTLRA